MVALLMADSAYRKNYDSKQSNYTQHNVICYTERHFFNVMLSAIMLSVIILIDTMLSIVMLRSFDLINSSALFILRSLCQTV